MAKGMVTSVGAVVLAVTQGLYAVPLLADDLYKVGTTQSLASDRNGSQVGDAVTVIIVQAAESSTSMQSGSRKSSNLAGRLNVSRIDENANFSLGGSYEGRGEVRRSERFVTQMTASIAEVLPNGDFILDGIQRLNINGEATAVKVRGRIRPADIDSDNRVPSNRLADAQINYDGKGFVSRSAKPGLLQRIFSVLGLS